MSNEIETKAENKEPTNPASQETEKKELTGPYSWLILGGVGFIGRHFAKYLVDNNLANAIRVTDKAHWAMSMLDNEHKHIISKVCEYKQADLTKKCTYFRAIFTNHQFYTSLWEKMGVLFIHCAYQAAITNNSSFMSTL